MELALMYFEKIQYVEPEKIQKNRLPIDAVRSFSTSSTIHNAALSVPKSRADGLSGTVSVAS